MRTQKYSMGFSLIELLLSIAIITILVGLSLPVYQTFQVRNDIDLSSQTIADALRRAEVYARSVKNDAPWGIAISAGTMTLFQGSSYATRDTTEDELAPIPPTITSSGLNEVVFAKLSGLPATNGTITLTSASDVRTITINAKGTIAY